MYGDVKFEPLLTRSQGRKLRRLLETAVANVQMYRQLYGSLNLTGGNLAAMSLLRSLPVVRKSDLLAFRPEERIDRRYRISRLCRESTTGSTGQPFSMYVDRRYRLSRNMRFLRALCHVGYRPWHRLLLLTDRYGGFSRRHGWYYQSVEAHTPALLEAYRQARPDVLYGFATPLRLLAEALGDRDRRARGPRLVISTAEMLDPDTRGNLESAFGCGVADFYGMTEMGLVAWKRPGDQAYTMAEDSVLTEFLADDACRGRFRLVVTNLDLAASPIIRFDTGDLAEVEFIDGRPAVVRFEGRQIDALACPDGSSMSPYRLTDALRDVPGLRRFQVTQHAPRCFAVDAVVDAALRDEAAGRIRSIFAGLFGPGIELDLQYRDRLVDAGNEKFRPVLSRVQQSL
jgi:phenylacetate-CoA ligase